MRALQPLAALSFCCCLFVGLVRAADDAPALQTAQGVVQKFEQGTLTVKPSAKDGRVEKTLALTGTSKVSTLSTQTRGTNTVFVQKDIDPKGVQAGQPIALVYAIGKGDDVLMSAVVQRAPAK
jgi:hypothetical protein